MSQNGAIGTLSRSGGSLDTAIQLGGFGRDSDTGLGSFGRFVSPDNTVVTLAGVEITTRYFDIWTITPDRRIVANGLLDTTTRNVIKLAYEKGALWQLNTAGNWYSKNRSSDVWSAPTTVSPIPAVPTMPISGSGRDQDSGAAVLTTAIMLRGHAFNESFSDGFDRI